MENSKILAKALTRLEEINESIAEAEKNIEYLKARSKTKQEQDLKDLKELETQLETNPYYSTEETKQVLQEESDSQDRRFYENYTAPLERWQTRLEHLQQDREIYKYYLENNK